MFKFLGEVKTELSKVVWPTRQETIKYTVVVIVFSLVVAAILGAADYGLLKAFEIILTRKGA
ncbi:MAG: preprotein translocase subunit SecE [Patescibacteria group bacterium]|nr:preprotein translocase subunit SecE [Patescibacteria group bacterium]